jgi:hypothetical protein
MKNQLFALIGLGLLLATASAYAQTGLVKASIPFSFIVEKTMLPPGNYSLHGLSAGNGRVMTIQSADRKFTKMVLPNSCESKDVANTTRLVFHRYGDQYFLAEVWMEGKDLGQQVARSRFEQEVAMSQPPMNVVVVATLR